MSQDPRGPLRNIIAIERWTGVTLLTLDCGHVGEFNQIFHYKLGHPIRCFFCGPHGSTSPAMVLSSHGQFIDRQEAPKC